MPRMTITFSDKTMEEFRSYSKRSGDSMSRIIEKAVTAILTGRVQFIGRDLQFLTEDGIYIVPAEPGVLGHKLRAKDHVFIPLAEPATALAKTRETAREGDVALCDPDDWNVMFCEWRRLNTSEQSNEDMVEWFDQIMSGKYSKDVIRATMERYPCRADNPKHAETEAFVGGKR